MRWTPGVWGQHHPLRSLRRDGEENLAASIVPQTIPEKHSENNDREPRAHATWKHIIVNFECFSASLNPDSVVVHSRVSSMSMVWSRNLPEPHYSFSALSSTDVGN